MVAEVETMLKEMTQRLVAEFQPRQIYLFGSYAWGQPNKDSDVDLLVVVPDSDQSAALPSGFISQTRARSRSTGLLRSSTLEPLPTVT